MRLIIDMQGAQTTGSRNRGIGRYTLSLTKEIARQRGEHEVILVLSSLFPETIEPIRAAFSEYLPEECIRVWCAVSPVSALDASNDSRRQAAELIREAFIASFKPDMVLTTSLFEGLVDDGVTSIGSHSTQLPSAVILYDLIPLIHRNIYLSNPVVEPWYLKKLDHLRRADLLLSISASSRGEALDYLGFSSEKVVNISTACDDHFEPKAVGVVELSYLQKTYGFIKPFVMYTGGIDHRKNIEALIRAYASLPKLLREAYQLAIVCSIHAHDRERLQNLAQECDLENEELVITGFVSEEDLVLLYNACQLFVFPSWHEGFGLPALEAMACGRAVIGANTSSVPEVIELEDALFDPRDDAAIANKIEQVLTDNQFRAELERHGMVQAQKFSWKQTAHRAWQAFEAFVEKQKLTVTPPRLDMMPRRPRLAYISPLPPEQSGISDYSAELLPELARHYQIEVIIAQQTVSNPWVLANCPIRDIAWFRQHVEQFDRVLYHFGNSDFHSHMFELLREIPGVVVLHDFFLSGIVAHLDLTGQKPFNWANVLVYSHGWSALQARYQAKDIVNVIWDYPSNLDVLQQAQGIIVHSKFSLRLASNWYGMNPDKFSHIPLLRVPLSQTNTKRVIGVSESDFVVCSFGLLGPTKLNHRLLNAWLASPLASDPDCRLVFVGQNHGGDYGASLVKIIKECRAAERIEITGWASSDCYRDWLASADVGVQLRTLSRGETSAAVLDCMNYGLATIVNANGSMADLPTDTVWMMPDEFSDEQLVHALTTLWKDSIKRKSLGQQARELIKTQHQPRRCAEQYAQAIEDYYFQASAGLPGLVDALGAVHPSITAEELPSLSAVLAKNFPPSPRRQQLLIDISSIVHDDNNNAEYQHILDLLSEYLANPPNDWMVEPIYTTTDVQGYRYARRFISRYLGVEDAWANDEPVEAWAGDVFYGLTIEAELVPLQNEHLLSWHRRGVKVVFAAYDLLPLQNQRPLASESWEMQQTWLETISHFDGVICSSCLVADKLFEWLEAFGPKRELAFALRWFNSAAEISNVERSKNIRNNAEQLIHEIIENKDPYLSWQHDGVNRHWYWGNDSRLDTQVGKRCGRVMYSTGQEGFLMHGPYASMAAGSYTLQVKGTAQNTKNSWLDVTFNKGEQRALHLDSLSMNERGDLIEIADFILESAVEDFEIRIWVSESCLLQFESFSIVPSSRLM